MLACDGTEDGQRSGHGSVRQNEAQAVHYGGGADKQKVGCAVFLKASGAGLTAPVLIDFGNDTFFNSIVNVRGYRNGCIIGIRCDFFALINRKREFLCAF
ncbi:hypothetical protein SB748_25420 [Rhizobium sp. SIMBA_035]